MNALSSLLMERRVGLGFKNKKSFFEESGGEKYFKCTYRFYSLIEQGKTFPDTELFVKLLIKLKIAEPNEFVQAFIVSRLKTYETVNYFTNFPKDLIKSEKELAPDDTEKVYYSETQLALLASSKEITWIYNLFLFNDIRFTLNKIAKFTNFDPDVIEIYLKRLEELNLIKKRGNYYEKVPFNLVMSREEKYKKYTSKIVNYYAEFSPAVPIHKDSYIFKINPNKLFILQEALSNINKLIRKLIRTSKGEKTFPYFFHSAIFERHDLNMK